MATHCISVSKWGALTCLLQSNVRYRDPRDAIPPIPPGPEGSNGNGLVRVQRAPRCLATSRRGGGELRSLLFRRDFLRSISFEFSGVAPLSQAARPQVRAKISALGTYVPPRLLTNADLEKMVETSDSWILERTGIRQRHIVDKGVATSDLAVAAAKVALEQRGIAPTDVEAIIVGTVTP